MGMEDINLTPNYSLVNTPAAQPDTSFLSSLAQYMPAASGLFSGLGVLYNMIQTIQRNKQMAALRKFYTDNWQTAANQRLSTLVGDAASRGLSGSPNTLAGLVANSYAPYQLEAGQGIASTIPQPGGIVNPFDQFIKALDAVKSLNAPRSNEPGIKFNYNDTRMGRPTLDMGQRSNMNPGGSPMFDVPSADLQQSYASPIDPSMEQ